MAGRRVVATVAALWLMLAGAPRAAAEEGGWSITFTAESVGPRLPVGELSLVVVAAGGTREARAAADALVAAIRAGGRAKSVLDDASLGDLGGASDGDIVARCAGLAVEYVATVRWLVPGRGEAPRALVSVYDKRGALVLGFTGRAGEPLGKPRSLPPLEPEVPVLVPAPRAPTTPEQRYDAQRIVYDETRPGFWVGDSRRQQL